VLIKHCHFSFHLSNIKINYVDLNRSINYNYSLSWREFIVPGLDPALPGFRSSESGSRISKNDASYVEIIHTNGGWLGYFTAIGDIDFYPNGGQKQVGCGVDLGGSCSHSRSYQYFAESITSHVGFLGRSCDSFSKFKSGLCNNTHASMMGGHKSLFRPSGTYYLVTNPSSPFAIKPFAM